MKSRLIATVTTFALASFLSTSLLMAEDTSPATAQQEPNSCNAYPEFQCGPTGQELEQEQPRNQERKLKKQMKKEAKRQAQPHKHPNPSRESRFVNRRIKQAMLGPAPGVAVLIFLDQKDSSKNMPNSSRSCLI